MNTTVSAFLRRSCGGSLSHFAKSTCVVPTRAGQRWRLMQGIGRSGNEDGPLHDMNDWEYADGTPAPETKKQQEWKRKRLNEEKKISKLRREVKWLEHKEALKHAAQQEPPKTN